MIPLDKWLTGSTMLGCALWLLLLLHWIQQPPDLPATVFLLLLLAIVVNTPLALTLLGTAALPYRSYRWALWLQPIAALCATASIFVRGGLLIRGLLLPWSALLVTPWLLFAGLLGISALLRISVFRQLTVAMRMHLAALLYLPIGAAWLVAFRLGIAPFGFSGIIVLLTAIHFHFTGFAATIWASIIGDYLPHNRLYPWLAGAFVLATPLIAAGITSSPLLEIVGVLLLTSSLLGLAFLHYTRILPWLTPGLAKGLLYIAPLSMMIAIGLAVVYGLGEYLQQPLLTIPQMVQWHGWLNAVGFTALGLLGWRLSRTQMEKISAAHHVVTNILIGEPRSGDRDETLASRMDRRSGM